MFHTRYSPLYYGLASFGFAMLVWLLFPHFSALTNYDRASIGLLSGSPNHITGSGTIPDPWKVIQRDQATDAPSPAVLKIDDVEPDYFEQLPPPPADLIVVLTRLNQRHIPALGIGYPLEWDDPDALAIDAMRQIMDNTQGLVLGYPLSRSSTPGVVAAPFQRASVAFDQLRGDRSNIPVIHRLTASQPELGGTMSWAGFTNLDHLPPDPDHAFLLARWSDRVVFSLPLAAEIARRKLQPKDIEIIIGQEIRLGPQGPAIPIDSRGRVALSNNTFPKPDKHSASAVIAETLPDDWPDANRALFITDERLLAPKESHRWAQRLPLIHHAIRSAPTISDLRPLQRPRAWIEIGALILLSGLTSISVAGWNRPGRLLAAAAWLLITAFGLALISRTFSIAPLSIAFLWIPSTHLILAPFLAKRPLSFWGKDRTYRRIRHHKLPINRPRQ